MTEPLAVEGTLSGAAQFVGTTDGTLTPLSLSLVNVGIGTTTPDAKLEVEGGSISVVNPGQGNVLLHLGSERHWVFRQAGADSHTALELANGDSKNFIINTEGNVGIGTTTPDAKLEVEGGSISVVNPGRGNVLLHLGSERHWVFRQAGADSHTALELANGDSKNFIINTEGNVGIGTTTPEAKLDVHGSVRVENDVILAGADCAEEFEVRDAHQVDAGTVLVIDGPQVLRTSHAEYDAKVVGVVSGAGSFRPGIVLGRLTDGVRRIPIALLGRVFCKVDATRQPIRTGDLLTTSPTPGHAMAATDRSRALGAVLGKALGSLDTGVGLIPMVVALQ